MNNPEESDLSNAVEPTQFTCRFYQNQLPSLDDRVMVFVSNVCDVGAYVKLLEYDDRDAMILMSELSRRRIRSLNKVIRVNANDAVLVMRVDKDKSKKYLIFDYIDLSKRRITQEEVIECEKKYTRAKIAHSIILHMAGIIKVKSKEELEDLMSKTTWFYEEKFKNTGGAYEGFRRAVSNTKLLDELSLSEEHKSILHSCIMRRMEPKKVKIRADIGVSCYTNEGVDAIKAALIAGSQVEKDCDIQISIKLISPPIFMIYVCLFDVKHGIMILNKAIEVIQQIILEKGGTFEIKVSPKVVSEVEDIELTQKLNEIKISSRDTESDEDSNEEYEEESNYIEPVGEF